MTQPKDSEKVPSLDTQNPGFPDQSKDEGGWEAAAYASSPGSDPTEPLLSLGKARADY